MSNKEIAAKALGGLIGGIINGNELCFTKDGKVDSIKLSDNGYPAGTENWYITCISMEGNLYANETNTYDNNTAKLLGFAL